MAQKTWHSRVVEAARRLGKSRGWILLSPCVVYLRAPDQRVVSYKPDCVWTSGKSRLNMVVWEVEDSPNPKSVAGDIALASMCHTDRAMIFAYDHPLGSKLRKAFIFRGLYDRRLKNAIRPGERVRLPRADRVSFVLVLKQQDDLLYYGRYLDVVAERNPRLFDYHVATWCAAASVSAAGKSLGRNLAIKKLEGV